MARKRKPVLLIGFLLLSIILINGCQTTAGVAKGVAYSVEGAGKDTYNLFKFIQTADKWIRENLW
jgi:predicted small secreted protein